MCFSLHFFCYLLNGKLQSAGDRVTDFTCSAQTAQQHNELKFLEVCLQFLDRAAKLLQDCVIYMQTTVR